MDNSGVVYVCDSGNSYSNFILYYINVLCYYFPLHIINPLRMCKGYTIYIMHTLLPTITYSSYYSLRRLYALASKLTCSSPSSMFLHALMTIQNENVESVIDTLPASSTV